MTYSVREINTTGKVVESIYEARSEDEVVRKIRSKGHSPVSIAEQTKGKNDIGSIEIFRKKVTLKDLSIFCRQMSTMLHAGMPLVESLNVIREQSDNSRLRDATDDMMTSVQQGEILSTSMTKHSDVFPSILINMVETGELSGNIDDVLERMAVHYKKENRIQQQISGALIYPMFIGVITVLAVIILLTFVMPTFVKMFTDVGSELPKITQILLNISDFIRGYWYLLAAGIGGIIFGIRQYLKTESGKIKYDRLLLNMPLIKGSIAKIATSRFTRTLSMLLASGVPLLDSLQSAANSTNNHVVIKDIDEVADNIKKGIDLSTLLREVKVFPPMMISMIKIGEESGSLEDMLAKSADFYEEELDDAIKKLTALIEPAMIVIMAGVVGFIVVAMLLPTFEMFSAIQGA